MNHRTRNFLAALLTASVLPLGVTDAFAGNRIVLGNAAQTSLAASAEAHTAKTLKELRSKAAKGETIRVIVGVRAAFAPEGELSIADVAQQRQEIADMHSAVLQKIPSLKAKPEKIKTFSTIPFMALEVDATELEALAGQAEITSIEEDRLVQATLAESVPLIGGTAAWSRGYTGAGQTVAILDTGVDKSHPFLTGKVVSEACYSTRSVPAGASSLCPGAVTQSTAAGSGVNCDPALSGCAHGTHVAGIAAGKGASFSGVAKDASLIAIQVFTRFDSVTTCGSSAPCIGAYTSDYNLALERVYLLRGTYSIAAVNMSLGGSGYSNQAACDSDNSSTKTAIDNLRSVNIATVIASGNNGFSNQISAPGCISTAISVGATSKTDVVASYSNSASFLKLLAPGSAINSSILGNAYVAYNGTSMATPHVAGAWALLKQQNPTRTVTDALSLLSAAGIPLTDARNGVVTPRIRLEVALNAAPTLTYSSETGYGTVGVSPTSGSASTLFTYKAIYTDITNIPPTSVRVCIDGTCNAMGVDASATATLRDSSYTNGEQYAYASSLTSGAHSYYFTATDGTSAVNLSSSGSLSGPTVSSLTISTSALPDGTVGAAYSQTLATTGGTSPYSWSSTALPTGLSLNTGTGVISGTPTTVGLTGFSANVTDAASVVFTKALSINVTATVPDAPIIGTATAGNSQASVTFTPPASDGGSAITGYIVRSSPDANNPFGIFVIGTGSPITITGLINGTAYTFVVSATNGVGESLASAPSNSVTPLGTPPVPTGLTVTSISATQNDLAWSASAHYLNITQYKIYRTDYNPTPTQLLIATLSGSPPVTSYSDIAGVDVSTSSYSVEACNGLGECSALSAGVSPTMFDTTSPTVPTGLSTTVISATQINLSWAASTDNIGVTKYKVYRSGLLIATLGNVLSYNNTGLSGAKTYSYTVQACDAANNCSAQSTAISATTPVGNVDLIMSALSVIVTSVNAGAPLLIDNTEINQGTNNMTVSSNTIKFYLSTDATITSGDIVLTGTRSVLASALTAGMSSFATTTVTVPAATASGVYYLGAIADAGLMQAETNETNNWLAGATIIVISDVDLVMSVAGTLPPGVNVGSTLTLYDTMVNQGTTRLTLLTVAITVGYYLSTDASVTTADTLIGTRAVSRLPESPLKPPTTLTISKTTPPGIYYIGVCADIRNVQPETDETNNCLAASTITVIRDVDLVMSAVNATTNSVHVGSPITINNTETNQGTTKMTVSSNMVKFYLSTDATITSADILLGARTVTALEAGASNNALSTFTVPKTMAPGDYYVGAIADTALVQPETNELNNWLAGASITVIRNVDLVMSVVNATTTSVHVGSPITINNTETNQGATNMTVSSNVVKFYLSTDATITSTDVLLGSRTVTALAAGASNNALSTFTVAKSTAPGVYYVGAIADGGSAQIETDEANNWLAGATITVIRDVDLVITAASMPASSVHVGSGFSISSTVMNGGTTAMTVSSIMVKFYLSPDGNCTTTDILLGNGSWTVPSLGPGIGLPGTIPVTVPKTVAPGLYYVCVIADTAGAQPETNETNNWWVIGTLTVIRDVDLVMTDVSTLSTSVARGATFVIDNTEANQGTTGMTVTSNTIKFYLSTDATINSAADIALSGSRAVAALAAGTSSPASTTVTVPATVAPGTYYVGAIADATSVQIETSEANNTNSPSAVSITVY